MFCYVITSGERIKCHRIINNSRVKKAIPANMHPLHPNREYLLPISLNVLFIFFNP